MLNAIKDFKEEKEVDEKQMRLPNPNPVRLSFEQYWNRVKAMLEKKSCQFSIGL